MFREPDQVLAGSKPLDELVGGPAAAQRNAFARRLLDPAFRLAAGTRKQQERPRIASLRLRAKQNRASVAQGFGELAEDLLALRGRRGQVRQHAPGAARGKLRERGVEPASIVEICGARHAKPLEPAARVFGKTAQAGTIRGKVNSAQQAVTEREPTVWPQLRFPQRPEPGQHVRRIRGHHAAGVAPIALGQGKNRNQTRGAGAASFPGRPQGERCILDQGHAVCAANPAERLNGREQPAEVMRRDGRAGLQRQRRLKIVKVYGEVTPHGVKDGPGASASHRVGNLRANELRHEHVAATNFESFERQAQGAASEACGHGASHPQPGGEFLLEPLDSSSHAPDYGQAKQRIGKKQSVGSCEALRMPAHRIIGKVEGKEDVSLPAKFEILTDGACPFCRWTRARIEPFDTAGRLRFLDYNDPEVASQAPFPRAELDQEMHVRSPDGSWSAGFAAWVVILRVLPPLAWLGWLLGTTMFRHAGPKLYRWIARNRYRLPGSPPPCRADVCAPPTRPAP